MDFHGWPDEATGLSVLTNGRIVVAGTACREPGPSDEDCDVAMLRYRANGSVDKDFGKGGRATADLGAAFGERVVGLVRLSDGRLLVAAQTYAQGGLDLALVRFKASGVIDRSFGRSGVVTADVAGATDEAGGVVLQPDGRAIVVGVAGDDDDVLLRQRAVHRLTNASSGNEADFVAGRVSCWQREEATWPSA